MPDKKEIVLQKCKNAIDYGEPIMDYSFYYEVIALLKEQDAIVRCKDCKHKEESVSPSWEAWCNRLHCGCDNDWYCADGERRTE